MSTQDIDELQLKAKEIATDALFNLFPISFSWMDKAGYIRGCNYQALKSLHLNQLDDIIGKHTVEVASQVAWENTQKVIATGESLLIEEIHTWPNADKSYFLSLKSPIKVMNDQIVGVVNIAIDITDRKLTELKYQASQESEKKALIESAQMKAEVSIEKKLREMAILLSSSIAHEIRTPLGALIASMQVLLEELPPIWHGFEKSIKAGLERERFISMRDLKAAISRAQQAVYAISSVIDIALLNVREAKINQDDFKACSIKEAVEGALNAYPFTSAQEKNLIQVNIENDFLYHGKIELTHHVLFNLIRNALYFICQDKKGSIHIACKSGKIFNTLIFKDTARGIAEKLLPHIFEGFFSRRTDGIGIGLAFSKAIMQAYGGDIVCESEEGEHTTFYLTFPIYPLHLKMHRSALRLREI